MRHGRGAHRQPGMAAVGLLDSIHCQEADRVDAQRVEVNPGLVDYMFVLQFLKGHARPSFLIELHFLVLKIPAYH